jgi:hypothetical protein
MKKWIHLTSCLFIFISCNNSADSSRKTGKTYSDTLLDEVMENHNIGMAKMSKIGEAQKRVQLAIDSIQKLPADLQGKATAYKVQLDSSLNKLKYADDAMNKWMEEFDLDSAKDNEEKRIEYLKDEKVKISKVNDAMLSSLKSADSLLLKRPK